MLRLIPCQAAATPITKVPAIAIARGPFVLLNNAPAIKPETKGIAFAGTGVHNSIDLREKRILASTPFKRVV